MLFFSGLHWIYELIPQENVLINDPKHMSDPTDVHYSHMDYDQLSLVQIHD